MYIIYTMDRAFNETKNNINNYLDEGETGVDVQGFQQLFTVDIPSKTNILLIIGQDKIYTYKKNMFWPACHAVSMFHIQ